MNSSEARPLRSLAWLREWLGLERNILVLLASILLVGLGEELWLPFVPKYLEGLGAGPWVIAVYGALKDLLDALYQYPGGWLVDRLGRRRGLALFALLASLGYLLYLVSPGWEGVLAGTIFVMAWSSLTSPAIFAIIGDNLPPARRAIGFGVQSIWKRIPRAIGPPLGGALIAYWGLIGGIRASLLFTIAVALISILVVLRYYVESTTPPAHRARLAEMWHSMDARLKGLLVADILARWAEGIPKVFIVLYVIDVLKIEALQFGWLASLEMLAAMAVYIPIAKLSDRMNRGPFVLLTFAFFALFPLALARASGLFWVAGAFVIAGLREIGEPSRKALIVDLAQETARGRAVGVYYLVRGLAVFPAPLLGGWLWALGPQWPFYTAFSAGMAGLLAYAVSGASGKN